MIDDSENDAECDTAASDPAQSVVVMVNSWEGGQRFEVIRTERSDNAGVGIPWLFERRKGRVFPSAFTLPGQNYTSELEGREWAVLADPDPDAPLPLPGVKLVSATQAEIDKARWASLNPEVHRRWLRDSALALLGAFCRRFDVQINEAAWSPERGSWDGSDLWPHPQFVGPEDIVGPSAITAHIASQLAKDEEAIMIANGFAKIDHRSKALALGIIEPLRLLEKSARVGKRSCKYRLSPARDLAGFSLSRGERRRARPIPQGVGGGGGGVPTCPRPSKEAL